MTGFLILFIYIALFSLGAFAVTRYRASREVHDYTSLKTVTFGDESAVKPDRIASILSVVVIFLITYFPAISMTIPRLTGFVQ